ncbi:MAG: BTAD domain-containing putative transcriptional regulator [Acidimicrobiales bacterium]
MTMQSNIGWFRSRPPAPPSHAIRRLRLLEVMSTRFDRPLTVIVGGGGHGKTTLLAQSMIENAFEPRGSDVWLCCNDRDRNPEHFLSGLSATITGDPMAESEATLPGAAASIDDIVDLLVLRSPESVGVIVDDVHVLDDSPSIDVLRELLERLPRNANLVLASRTMPAVGVRLHQSRGSAVVIHQQDLELTTDERAEIALVTGHRGDAEDLPAWPALAVLTTSLGRDAGIDYVWDALLADLAPARREALARLALFSSVDHELATAVLGPDRRLDEVLDGVPLVDRVGDEYRLHDLWSEALDRELDAATRRQTHIAAARHLEQRGNQVRAARHYHRAGATSDVERIAREVASLPIAGGLDRSATEEIRTLLAPEVRDGPLGRCLLAITHWADADPQTSLRMHEADALSCSDAELQSLAWWRLLQRLHDAEARDDAWRTLARPTRADEPANDASGWIIAPELVALAEAGWPFAKASIALVRSHVAELDRDIDAAVAALDQLDAPDATTLLGIRAARLVALGRPEDVPVSLVEVLESGASQAVLAQAVWLRGEVRAADAWAIAAPLPARYARRRFPNVEIPLLATVSGVALAADEVTEARRLADSSLSLAARTRRAELFAAVADAQCLLVESGDDAARLRFQELLAPWPLEPWPPWPYLSALCSLRALVPEAVVLDDMSFGPSLALAVDAGRTIAELRGGAPLAIAAALPWGDPALLEVHVLPPLRCELALAASTVDEAAAEYLDAMAGRDRYLRRLLDHPNAALAARAADLVSAEPQRPDHDLVVTTLGGLQIERSDGKAIDTPSGRVAQLLGLLVHERSLPRQAVMARLWPDLAAGAASNNLRVNLHKLLDLIEPERGSAGSFWIRVRDDRLELAPEGFNIDRDLFDHHQAQARDAESQGAPSAADEHYAAMRALYRGPYLDGLDDDAIEPERVRLATLAYAACCRRAELALGRGEPEAALDLAVDAQTLDPLGERAVRSQILAQLALGARSAAAKTAGRLVDHLTADGLAPEPETRSILARLERAGAGG